MPTMTNFTHRVPVDTMIASANAEIEAIKTASGFREAHFRALCMPVLRSYADHVQQMPLSPLAYKDKEGAWQFGLTSSMVALRYAGTQMFFPLLESEERRVLEPQCRFAAFAATLATGVAMLAQHSKIHDTANPHNEYHALITPMSLAEWIDTTKSVNFSWRTNEPDLNSMQSAAIAARFMPTSLLATFDLRVSMMFYSSILPQISANGIETSLSKVVRLSVMKVVEMYIENDKKKYIQNKDTTSPLISDAVRLAAEMIESVNPSEIINPLEVSSSESSASQSNASIAVTQSSDGNVDMNSLMKKANPVLKDWFEALKSHEKFSKLKDQLVVTEQGIEVPVIMLGGFGVNGPTIKKFMEEAGMVLGRSANARAIVVSIALKPLFFGVEF